MLRHKVRGIKKRIRRRFSYKRWMQKPLYTAGRLEEQRKDIFDCQVKFSIITPLCNTKKKYLRDMIESVIGQTYSDWELCLADSSDMLHEYVGKVCLDYADKDSRIKYKKLEKDHGIAGNANICIKMAEGDYISLLDQDDVLHPAALHDVMEMICGSNADFVYTDEVVFKGSVLNNISEIRFKKDYAPDDLRAVNYIGHFTSIRRTLIEKCGDFRESCDLSRYHEFFLRLTASAEKIVHIPEVLYCSRASEKPAVHRVSYGIPADHPKVSLIIPNCDHIEDLRDCVSSILKKTTYDNYEIVIAENNSNPGEIFEYYKTLQKGNDNVRVITCPVTGFNWSAINNYAVREAASGEYVLLLNNDTEVISHDWIQEMLMYAQRPDIGAVGAMLYYPDDTVQHAGVIVGLGGPAGHAFNGCRRGENGYMDRLSYAQDMSAVTGACMMMRRSVYDQLEGMDEKLAVGLNDIDFCLRARKSGYMIIWTPYAELYHYESKSRGKNDTPEDGIRSEQEKALFCDRWADILEKGDPYYNPNLSLLRSDFEPKKSASRYRMDGNPSDDV